MYIATIHRMARLWENPLGGWLFSHHRMAMSFVIMGGFFLLSTHTAYAQSMAPEHMVVQAVPPQDAADVALAANSDPMSAATLSSAPIHVVEVGDTLSNIAERYNVDVANLAVFNQILDYNHVIIGQKLRIPPVGQTITAPAVDIIPGSSGYHVVRMGDSLSGIASKYNMTMDELMALNEITDPNLVPMGMMLRLTDKVKPPDAAIQPVSDIVTYTVRASDTLTDIAAAYHTTIEQIMSDNELTDREANVGQQLLIDPPATSMEAFGVQAPVDGERLIVIDLSDQTLTAYQGGVKVLYSVVSTGKDSTPTRVGDFAIYQKFESQEMTGDDYDLPGVPWVMYYDKDYAMHGAYWNANLGFPTSHGCTNMSIPESKALYSWAPVGTHVSVQQ